MNPRWDLTVQMAPYLDTHLLLPLLEHLRESGIVDAKAITKEKIKIVSKTNMIDIIQEEYAKVSDEDDIKAIAKEKEAELEVRRNKVFDELDNEPEGVKEVSAFFADESKVASLKSAATLTAEFLANTFDLGSDKLISYYKY